MSNDVYIPDDKASYLQQQIAQEHEQHELMLEEDYQEYLAVLEKGE